MRGGCCSESLLHQEWEESVVVKVFCIKRGGCYGEGLLHQE